jgi:AcrR family transcriptional regulator
MRRIAEHAGCSTTVLYTMFGGKDGIAEAIFREGFDRFRRRLEDVPRDSDPLRRLVALGEAYRENALAERSYYGVMFLGAIPGFEPSPAAVAAARMTLEVLAAQVQLCIDAGLLRPADSWEVAEVLWAAAHGAVSLELAGHFADETTAASRFRTLAVAAGMAYLAKQTTEPEKPRETGGRE